MATPSLAMIPSAYADSKVYSVLPNNGDGDFTFNRDSSATRVGQNGLIQTVGFFGNNLVTNGDFSNGSTDWGLGSNWSVANGKASCDGSASNSMSQASTVGIASTTFKVSYDVLSISQGSIRITLGGVAGSSVSQVGSYSDFITATSTDRLRIFADSSAIASIDKIVVQQVTGDQPRLNYDISNGVVQSCPSLLLEPASTNSFPNSEDYTVFGAFSNGTGTNPVITSNYSVSPDGTQNADRIQFNRGSGTLSIDTSYVTKSLSLGTIDATLSIYLKTNDGTTKDVTLRLGTGLFDHDVIVTSEWKRFALSGNTSVDRVQILLYGNQNSQTADLSCFGTQVEALSYATSYIPTNGASQTRAAETCFLHNIDNGILNQSAFTLFYDTNVLNNTANNFTDLIALYDTAASTNLRLESRTDSKVYVQQVGVVSSGDNFNSASFGSNSVNFKKFAISCSTTKVQLWADGNKINEYTGVYVYAFDKIGFRFNDASVETKIQNKSLQLFDTALTDAQLQTLTTL